MTRKRVDHVDYTLPQGDPADRMFTEDRWSDADEIEICGGDDDPKPTGSMILWILLFAMIGAVAFILWAATWWTP